MNVEKAERTVDIDSSYYLMQVFNAINTERTSMVFVFQGVRFWRENEIFMLERDAQAVSIGDVIDFDEFKKLLLKFDENLNG